MNIIRPKFARPETLPNKPRHSGAITIFMNGMLFKSKGEINQKDAEFIGGIKGAHMRWVADGRPQSNGEMT